MTPNRKLSPEVVKKAAEMAVPGCEWFIRRTFHNLNQEYIDDVLRVDGNHFKKFDVIDSTDDAWALCEALERRGIIFKCIWTPSRDYYCWHFQNGDSGSGGFETKQEAMLKAVADLHSLDLYVEGK